MSMFGQSSKTGAKPTASLSSTLLARKGQAKPAMRPQGFGGFGSMPGGQDDLGWNDMGADAAPPAEPVAAPTALPAATIPPVLIQREVLREEYAMPAEMPAVAAPAVAVEAATPSPEPIAADAPRVLRPISVATAARFGRETAKKNAKKGTKQIGRAAFTLRLDQDRHLRLRIAAAINNASAQTLVTEALDQFLQALPEVDALIAQLPARGKR